MTSQRGQARLKERHRIGMVFQHFNLAGNRSVLQNVEDALEAVDTPIETADRLNPPPE